MNQSPAPIAPATRTLKTLSVVARLCLWLVFLAWGLFVLTWAALNWWIVPRIADWRPELERWASSAVGAPVRVGEIRADKTRSGLAFLPAFMPSFELRDVQLFDPQGRVALQLPLVRTAVSVRSLWHGNFEQVVIDQPVLDVRRTAQGRIEVAGLDMAGPGQRDGRAADWFFSLREFVIQNGTVRWTDELRAQPPLALGALTFVVRNTARTHQFRLDATPPPEWGERLSVRGRLREPLIELGGRGPEQAIWHNWDGELYADFTRVDVARLRAYADLSTWGVDVRAGHGALRAWAEVNHGALAGATTDLALRDVEAQLGPELPALAIEELQGRLTAQWSDAGFSVSSDDLRFRTREGVDWPSGRLLVRHTAALAGQGASTEVSADRLELGAIAALASRLPLPAEAHRRLEQLRPQGRVDGLSARWQRAAASAPSGWDLAAYQAKGRVSALAVAGEPSGRMALSGRYPLPGRPGISGATVDFDLSQAGGRAHVSVADGALELPDVFEEPSVAVDQLAADLSWRVQGERIEAQLDNVRLSNADAEGTAQLRWQTSEVPAGTTASRFPGVLDLTATLTRADATRVHRYLPLSVNADARHYVREAVRGGSSNRVEFRVQGPLDHAPFDRPGDRGEFRISAALRNVDFDYIPAYLQKAGEMAWPALRGVSGDLLLDRASLKLTALEGGVANAPGVRLSKGQVGIEHLGHDGVLVVSAQAQGPANEALGFVQGSPLNAMTGQALARARSGAGAAQVGFALRLPLADPHATKVSGTVRLEGSDLQVSPDAPLLGRASGQLAFSESGFSVKAAQARVYGGDLRFEGGMQADAKGVTQVQFRGQGLASAEGLREAGLGFVSRLFQHASGSTAYTAQLGIRAGVPEWQVTSNLQGMALNLPAPLNKAAEASLPLRYDNHVLSVVGERARTDRLAIQLGSSLAPVASLQYERELGAGEPRVLRGAISIGVDSDNTAASLPTEGVVAHVQFAQLDTDAWERAFSTTTGVDVRTAATAGATVLPRVGPVADPNASLSYLPTTLAVRADRLTVRGRHFHRVVLGGSREGAQWQANIDANELNGYVSVRQAGAGTAGNIYARLKRLQLEPSAANDVEQLLDQPTTSVPSLDIAVDELTMAGRNLGRVEVEAINRGGPLRGSEWRLTRLRVASPEARLSATGNWVASGAGAAGQRRTALNFRLDIDDSGQLLNRFGREGLVRGGRGRLEGNIGWIGSPLAIDYPSLSGQIHADIERGQFLKVDPGAGRLLGVLSLQALPRRLVLDFRDVFSEGFAFDFVRGDARIEQGVLHTNNLQMKGVNAAVLMEGSADIAREQQDLKVVVVPEINAGTASLIATAINPAIGLGTFLAQFLLRQPLQSATTQEFRITGSWADPQVDKVERASPAAVAPRDPTPVLQ